MCADWNEVIVLKSPQETRANADRASTLITFGGGVIGDMAGFAAATYLRGIALVHVPTTLLAQVYSAVGGNVGINHALGKNLIGAERAAPKRIYRDGVVAAVLFGIIFHLRLQPCRHFLLRSLQSNTRFQASKHGQPEVMMVVQQIALRLQ